jgi:hypothetical protein
MHHTQSGLAGFQRDDVNSNRLMALMQQHSRGAQQSLTLGAIDRRTRPTKIRATAGLHLDHQPRRPIARQEIDFDPADAGVSLDNLETLVFQIDARRSRR